MRIHHPRHHILESSAGHSSANRRSTSASFSPNSHTTDPANSPGISASSPLATYSVKLVANNPRIEGTARQRPEKPLDPMHAAINWNSRSVIAIRKPKGLILARIGAKRAGKLWYTIRCPYCQTTTLVSAVASVSRPVCNEEAQGHRSRNRGTGCPSLYTHRRLGCFLAIATSKRACCANI